MLKSLASAGALSLVLLGAGASAAMADSTVNPPPPTFLDTCGVSHDVFIIPQSDQVSYYQDGIKLQSGKTYHVNASSPTVTIFPVANSGVTLSQTTSWSHTFNTGTGGDDTGCSTKSASATSTSTGKDSSSAPAIPQPSNTTQTIGPSSGPTSAHPTVLPHTGIDLGDNLAGIGVATLAGVGFISAGAATMRKRRKSQH